MLSLHSVEFLTQDTISARLAYAEHERLLAQLPARPSSATRARHALARGLRAIAKTIDPTLVAAAPPTTSNPRWVVLARSR